MTAIPPSGRADPLAIEARGIRRTYAAKPRPVEALRGVDLDVHPGEFFGLLGPNGAGKTTLIKILTTLLLPTSGTARVCGFDVATETAKIRRIMNMVAGGEQSGYGLLNVREQLWMFSQFYGLDRKEGWRRVDELVAIVGLHEQARQKTGTLSTGQRQKLNLARGMLNDPWVLFLDEPTLGLDVNAARDVRALLEEWRLAVPGRTVLLTTHYMVEADELCGRIAIVDRGRILALGSPAELKQRIQRESIYRFEVDRLPGSVSAIAGLPGVLTAALASAADVGGVDAGGRRSVIVTTTLADDGALPGVVAAIAASGAHLLGLAKSEPTLEDVFVELVGHGIDEETTEATAADAAAPDAGGPAGPSGPAGPALTGDPVDHERDAAVGSADR